MTISKQYTDLASGEISSVVEKYMGAPAGACVYSRPQSWDFCFEYFSDMDRVTSDLQTSCMQLGYYLASWGMLRGGGHLFRNTNARHYLDTLKVIEDYDPVVREVTPEQFRDPQIQELLVELYSDLNKSLLPDGGRAITLVTKTMMGVWGLFPSLDSYFMDTFKGFARTAGRRGIFHRFSAKTVGFVGEFYNAHREEIESLAEKYRTADFETGTATERQLPAAKVIDIYGFNASFNP